MIIEILEPPAGLPPFMPAFVVHAFERLRVQARKVNGKYRATKAVIVESMIQRKYGFVYAAKFVEEHTLIKEEIEIPENACTEIE